MLKNPINSVVDKEIMDNFNGNFQVLTQGESYDKSFLVSVCKRYGKDEEGKLVIKYTGIFFSFKERLVDVELSLNGQTLKSLYTHSENLSFDSIKVTKPTHKDFPYILSHGTTPVMFKAPSDVFTFAESRPLDKWLTHDFIIDQVQ